MADEFCDQLKKLREEYKDGKICEEELDETIESLEKIKKSLKAKDNATVEIKNWRCLSTQYTLDNFNNSIQNAFTGQKDIPVVTAFYFEDIFFNKKGVFHGDNDLFEQDRAAFLDFECNDQAERMLGMRTLRVFADWMRFGVTIELTRPSRPAAVRQAFRNIGNGINRIKEIRAEYETIGINKNSGGPPELSDSYMDKAAYSDMLDQIKKRRVCGSYAHHDRGLLVGMKPVDSASLKARLAKLYDEEMEILIQLRQYQIDGIEFDF